jgi:hypothetical protein
MLQTCNMNKLLVRLAGEIAQQLETKLGSRFRRSKFRRRKVIHSFSHGMLRGILNLSVLVRARKASSGKSELAPPLLPHVFVAPLRAAIAAQLDNSHDRERERREV